MKNTKVIFPPNLQTDEFAAAWRDWEQYRKEIKHPLTPTSIKLQLELLSKTPNQAVGMLKQSMISSWQGLFPIKGDYNGKTKPVVSKSHLR